MENVNLKEHGFDVTKEQELKIKEHYSNPKNNSALKKYNARGIGKNPDNFGQVDIYLDIDENKVIQNLGYLYRGCPTIAFVSSIFTEELKGVSLKEALETTQIELKSMNAQENCDDCGKMILVAFICANDNYHQRLQGENIEDYNTGEIEITTPYTPQACG